MSKRTLVKGAKRGGPRKKPAKRGLRLAWVAAGSLDDNPGNWRRHPEGQVAVLSEVLADPTIGWAGALLYNERTKRLIDGHARKNVVDPKVRVPVLIGDWSEEAEAKILAVLDPLGAMAEADATRLEKLLAAVDLSAPVFEDLAGDLDKMIADGSVGELPAAGAPSEDPPQHVGGSWKVVAECKSAAEQRKVQKMLSKARVACHTLTRGVRAD